MMKHKDNLFYLYVSPINYISLDYFPKLLDTNFRPNVSRTSLPSLKI